MRPPATGSSNTYNVAYAVAVIVPKLRGTEGKDRIEGRFMLGEFVSFLMRY